MAIADPQAIHTPDELLAMPDGKHFELVGGNLVDRPMGSISSWIGGQLYRLIANYLDQHKLGWVWPADNSFQCFPDSTTTVRRPDVSFIRRGRLANEQLPTGHVPLAPDLVAEVLSPHDLAYEIDAKVRDYVSAGVRLVWVINPETRTVRIHRLDGSFGWLTEKDQLDGEDVLPEFRCPVSKLFPTA